MTKDKIVHSVSIPKSWGNFISVAMKWLQDNGYRHGKPIFVYHVYIESLKLFAEKIGYDLSTANGVDVEFIEANKLSHKIVDPLEKLTRKMENDPIFRIAEYKIVTRLSKTPKGNIMIKDYHDNYKPKGISLQEFMKIKELDL